MEVWYDYVALAPSLDRAFWRAVGASMWHYASLLPLQDGRHIISLGTGNTPLLPSRHIGPALGLEHLLFKNDAGSPTWSQKDRLQTVTVSMARALGYRQLVAISTGNYGASLAAHAAAAGLRALVLCPEDVSPLLLRLIRSYGADVIVSAWGAAEQFLPAIVARGGWYPVTSTAYGPPACPYGIEGAKTIAYELFRQCDGLPPDAVLVPCASGDTLAGIGKGFAELKLLGQIERLPRLYGCQPSGAPALARTIERGLDQVVVIDHPYSVATSTRETTSGVASLRAIRASGGGAPVTSDEAILEAMDQLAQEGLCVEPSSALPVACLSDLLASRQIQKEETVVCLLTSAGIKWPATLGVGLSEPEVIPASLDALDQQLTKLGLV
jgi:threonine synthase